VPQALAKINKICAPLDSNYVALLTYVVQWNPPIFKFLMFYCAQAAE